MQDLYSEFQKTLETKDIQNLDVFKERAFWGELSQDEKKELASLFLKRAELELFSISQEEGFLQAISLAEELAPFHLEIFCKSAFIFFRYGMMRQKGRYLLCALDKLMYVEEEDAQFFENHSEWFLLWGNTFVALSRLLKDSSFLQKALEKYALGEKGLKDSSLLKELYWSYGEAWILLGEYSQEILDFQKGIEKYILANRLGCSLPHFRIDFGEALSLYGTLKGDPNLLEEALSLFRGAIADTYYPKKGPTAAYLKGWVTYALAAKKRFELTHAADHLQEADAIFGEAVTNVLEKPELWLYWGELYLHSGWIKRDLNEIETGLEKLTSSKIKECDPLAVSALLAQGLAILGYLLEDFKLLKEGKERIEGTLELAPENSKLLFSAGFTYLCEGHYFSDAVAYNKAIFLFERNLERNGTDTQNWHALFQAYFGCAQATMDLLLFQKALDAIARLSNIRPYSPIYYKEWGVALLRAAGCESTPEKQQELIEEAIEKFKSAAKIYEDVETLNYLGCAFDLLGDLTGNDEDFAQAIEVLTKVFEKKPQDFQVRRHLALSLSHYGELASHFESLTAASELFSALLDKDLENEDLWCEWGYCLLNQAVLVDDVIHRQKADCLRSEAEKKLIRAAELGSADACYHLACLYSLCGLLENSMEFLERASRLDSLPSDEDLEQDEWLVSVRNTHSFKEFLANRKQKKVENG